MHENVLTFWFVESRPSQWWTKDKAYDGLIQDRFKDVHIKANRCELHTWRDTPGGRLAEVIVLDQFSRNIYRDMAGSFASDALALALAQEAVAAGVDQQLEPERRTFLYMPYMHSESLAIHDIAVDLFRECGQASNLDFELRHKAIIERFGRYPHRNAILGRESTAEEIEFLKQKGSRF